LFGDDLVSDSPDVDDFSDVPDEDGSFALSVDFVSSEAPDEDESFALSVDFKLSEAPDEGEVSVALGDSIGACAPPEASGAVESVPDVPLGDSVPVVPFGAVVSPPEEFPPAQAPRINDSPNTNERAANFRVIMNLLKFLKSFVRKVDG
jgi:hypothetical protein